MKKLRNIILIFSILIAFPTQTASANYGFTLNKTSPTWTREQRKADRDPAIANIQSGLEPLGASVNLSVITDTFYNGVREQATSPLYGVSTHGRYSLYYYQGYGTIGQFYRLDSWGYTNTNSISGIWAP